MATPAAKPGPSTNIGQNGRRGVTQSFWERVTEGMALEQLWTQFKNEAQTTYRFYSRELPTTVGVAPGTSWQRCKAISSAFFWSVMNKLSPARRLLLLAGVVMLVWPLELSFGLLQVTPNAMHVAGGLVLLLLLLLEVADRITMKRDLQIAREIQSWLLPSKTPSICGLDIAFHNRPANTVAGDYYDVISRDGAVLIAVADVAGKSLPAALLMATLQASLRTLASRSMPLMEIVTGLNQYACTHSNGGQRFTTAFIAEYIPESGTLNYVNAGHNAPVLRGTDGTIEHLERGGVPLGIEATTRYESGTARLEPGDTLLIFTDGLVEGVNAGSQEYGEARLIERLHGDRSMNSDALLTSLLRHFDAWVGTTPQHDDVTLVVVRRTA